MIERSRCGDLTGSKGVEKDWVHVFTRQNSVNLVLSNCLTLALDFYQELRYLFLLLTYTDGLISARNIIMFLPNPSFANEKILLTPNEKPYPE